MVNFSLTDNLSGANYFLIRLRSPSGNQQVERGNGFPAARDLSESVILDFPQFSEAGVWSVYGLSIADAAGNRLDYCCSPESVTALGFPTELYVIDLDTRPAINGISQTSGAQGATISATISGTNLSGAAPVVFSGTGVTAAILSGGTATSLPVTIAIAPGAAPDSAGFDPLVFHEWKIRWGLGKITYFVDGIELFSATSFIPQGPMRANIIAWGPASDWSDAYDSSLQPAAVAGENQRFAAFVDWVSVAAVPSAP